MIILILPIVVMSITTLFEISIGNNEVINKKDLHKNRTQQYYMS